MRKFTLLITALTFCFSFSCKKEKHNLTNIVDGYVIDIATNDTITDALIQVWEDDRGGTILQKEFDRKIAETSSDTNGYFKIIYNCSKLKYYGIIASKKLYTNLGTVTLVSCGLKIPGDGNLYLWPLSWMKIHIKNELPTYPDDSIFFAPNINKVGEDVDTVFYREFTSTSSQIDYWDITQNGITTRYSQITNCTPFDTCQLNINY